MAHVSASSRSDLGNRRPVLLIELLVVVIILGLVSALVVTGVSKVRTQAADVACRENVRAATTAIEWYGAARLHYPEHLTDLEEYLRARAPLEPGLRYEVSPDGHGYTLVGTRSDGITCDVVAV